MPDFRQTQVLPLTRYMTLGKLLSLCLSFLICKLNNCTNLLGLFMRTNELIFAPCSEDCFSIEIKMLNYEGRDVSQLWAQPETRYNGYFKLFVDTSSASIEPLGCDLSPNIQASRLHFRTEKSQG